LYLVAKLFVSWSHLLLCDRMTAVTRRTLLFLLRTGHRAADSRRPCPKPCRLSAPESRSSPSALGCPTSTSPNSSWSLRRLICSIISGGLRPTSAPHALTASKSWSTTSCVVRKWVSFSFFILPRRSLVLGRVCYRHRRKLLESGLTAFSMHTNVIKITIPKNCGHFERRATVGRKNTPLNSYVAVSRAQ